MTNNINDREQSVNTQSFLEEPRAGMYYVIPAQIFEDERLEHSEVMFYGLLSGLASSKGYAFASDSYLAKRMKVSDRCIRDWIKKLEDIGYIHRETTKKGVLWERKIFINHAQVLKTNSNNSYERNSSSARTELCERNCSSVRKEPQFLIESKDIESKESSSEAELTLTPPTKEEDEEIDKRIKNRKNKVPIGNPKGYRLTILQEIRQQAKDTQVEKSRAAIRRAAVASFDSKTIKGFYFSVYDDRVEVSMGQIPKTIYYTDPDEVWDKYIGSLIT